jgi:hypothetical protein
MPNLKFQAEWMAPFDLPCFSELESNPPFKYELTAESRILTTFVFSYAVTKNCIITVL